jgi:ferric enterobactin receptor
MTKGILVVMFSFVVLILQAQKENDVNVHGRITGKVVDSLSGEPMEYVTITILMQGNKNPVNGSISDKSGNFLIDNISKGNYRIVIEFMGFQPFTFNNIDVTSENLLVDLKTILMVKDVVTLKDVIITAKGKIIDNKIDKVVFNAENDLTSQGGVAIDILKKVPQVSVDIDGTVELAGSSSIRFLIDGKPSSAFGSNITDVLQSIPASQIKSIEVVTNPGAKYDAQGIGGIINIILKKSNVRGYNGNLSLTAGTRQENGSLNLSARKNNFGINAFISGNERLAANASNNYQRISQNISDSTTDILNQDGSSSFTRYGMQSGVGFDWTVKKKNNFSGSLNYNEFGNAGSGFLNQSQITILNDGSGEIISNIQTHNNNSSSFRNHGIDANLNYKRKFTQEGRELEINANSSFENNNNKANNNQLLMPQDSLIYGSNNINPGKENETEIKIDYTEPLSKKVILGTGAKLSSYNINSTSDVLSFQPYAKNYLFDSSLSNYLRYHQKIYAVYAELSFPAGDLFDAKFGGRYERTSIYSYYSNAQEQASATGYITFVPSVFLLRKLTDSKTIKLSYSKRIERPDYGDLNPFINTSDPKNISSGNPYLKPEQGSRYEFSFSNDLGSKGSYVITAFFRNNKDDIQNFIIYYPSLVVGDSTYTNVAVSTRENIGIEKNAGLSLFGNINFTKDFNVRTNVFAFYRHTINAIDTGYNSNSFNYRFNINASYQFTKTLAAEFFGNFNSARHQAQGTYPSFTTYSVAIRKQLWKKKGSIALTANNPFNEYVNRRTTVFGPGFTVTNLQRIPFRSFGINFTWKFGTLEFKKIKEDNSINLNPPTE